MRGAVTKATPNLWMPAEVEKLLDEKGTAYQGVVLGPNAED
jgi:hypothetical protein